MSTTPLGRRAFLRTATAAATMTAAGLAASSPATAHGGPRHHGGRPPETVALPAGIRPEGITSGPGDRFYVGSLADGRIVAGDLSRGTSRLLLPGAAGRSLRGLAFDPRSGLVWAAGNAGADARVYAVHAWKGTIEHDVLVPDGRFLNDLVVTRRAVWVTDSMQDRLTRIALRRDGEPAGGAATFLALSGQWPAGDGVAFNANGIRQLSDGSLVLNNTRVGGLWRVHPASGDTTQIPVSGGPGIVGGDGLELRGRLLYNVRGSGPAEVSVLWLSRHRSRWQARWVRALTDETLDVPSTATLAGRNLWAVNARFGVVSPDTADYWITRLPAT